MAEYIDRSKLGIGFANTDIFENKGYAEEWNSAVQLINECETEDVEPVRHGYWQVGYFHDRVCSCCLHPDNDFDDYPHPYCPNCGAKMDGERR